MLNERVFIGRLTHTARKSDIERFFKGYGRLREISLKNGCGFVKFSDRRLAFLILVCFNQSLCTL